MLRIEDITEVRPAANGQGYEIVFSDGRAIWVVKRRAMVGLLLLIKYEHCSEADLVGANDRLITIKSILQGKINPAWIQDRYGDANKPFSELWTEEGFSCVHAEGMQGNRQYVLRTHDHDLLFHPNAKSTRIQLTSAQKQTILSRQNNRCNICNAELKDSTVIVAHTFSKDRVKCEFDHRRPIDHGGENELENIQALCHYCNKCKRQMCFVCAHNDCSEDCALVFPESNDIVIATGENIIDRINSRQNT